LAELRVDDCRPRLNQALQRQVRDDRLDELHAIALSRAAGDLCHWAAL
ncbi:chorismate mutase, partial [Pseudomonas aeruginosa]|nr:chorismate mutase [Pseudomonas aeruginosa]MBF3187919.1 chorismate mutase [Pseudomonas aeruginosa]